MNSERIQKNSERVRPISSRFEPILWHVWWNLATFLLHHAQKTGFFSKKRIDSKRHPKTCKRLPTSSKCRNAIFLIIFYGGLHTFHSDPRMRSMPNYLHLHGKTSNVCDRAVFHLFLARAMMILIMFNV